jgi:hypothetical protein
MPGCCGDYNQHVVSPANAAFGLLAMKSITSLASPCLRWNRI